MNTTWTCYALAGVLAVIAVAIIHLEGIWDLHPDAAESDSALPPVIDKAVATLSQAIVLFHHQIVGEDYLTPCLPLGSASCRRPGRS
jgi:hypothetical protein